MIETSDHGEIHQKHPLILGVMAKYWAPGQVKTRLGAHIGFAAAAHLHRVFCLHLAHQLTDTAKHRNFCVAPSDQVDNLAKEIPPKWGSSVQASGDLGNRIRSWFCEQRDTHRPADAVLIGADCPTIDANRIELAAESLLRHDVVLGPARDGGYYLVGLRECWKDEYETLFSDIPWSTERVFEITQQRAASVGLSVATLPAAEDIDTIDELSRLRQHLAQQSDSASKHLENQINIVLRDHASSEQIAPEASHAPGNDHGV